MSLRVIKGPLNSGRTGVVLDSVRAQAASGPILVTPTAAARSALEEELCARTGSILGIEAKGPRDLAEAVLRSAGAPVPQAASQARRLLVVRRALSEARPVVLKRSATSRRFPHSLLELFDELSAAGVGTRESYAHIEDRYVQEVLLIYDAYREDLRRRDITDASGVLREAARHLRENPDAWGSRPVFFLGFNDFSQDQLDLVSALAGATSVTVSVTHEDRASLRARSSLAADLAEIASRVDEIDVTERYADSVLLSHLDRSFGEAAAPAAYDGSVRLLRAAGDRGEAELVGLEIKRLLHLGVPPSRIAIAVRSPSARADVLVSVLRGYGIPVSAGTEKKLSATAVGGCITGLLAAACGNQTAASLLRYLRTHPEYCAHPATDDLERRMRLGEIADAAEAATAWERAGGAELAELSDLSKAGEDGVRAARKLVRLAFDMTTTLTGSPSELKAGSKTVEVLDEIASAAGPGVTSEDLAEILSHESAPPDAGDAGESVRITSPYTLHTSRSARPDHLFVIGLNDGEFPRKVREEVFLTSEQRAALGIRQPAPGELEELYLFQVCVATPTGGLWLSTKTSDDEGKPLEPSPYLEMVGKLIEGGLEAVDRFDREISAIVFDPTAAPGPRERQRGLAALYPAGESGDGETDGAAMRGIAALEPRDLSHPDVLAELEARSEISCTALEAFCKDPGGWLVERELRPAAFDLDAPALRRGSLAHDTLQRLFTDPPLDGSGGMSADEADWMRSLAEAFAIERKRQGLADVDPVEEAELATLLRTIGASVRCDVEWLKRGFEPRMIEASFGSRDDCERPALELAPEVAVSGKIDRVDVRGEAAVVIDFKTSREITAQAAFAREGLLQLPVYSRAVRELWELEPVAALYRPLRAADPKARGMLNDEGDSVDAFGSFNCAPNDRLPAEDFERLIDEACERAITAARHIASGTITGEGTDGGPPRDHDVRRITRRFNDRYAEKGENGDRESVEGSD